MSKHNYSQYSKKTADAANRGSNNEVVHNAGNNDNLRPIVDLVPDTSNEAVESFLVEETVETVTLPETVKGTVVDCNKLNVRTEPKVNAPVACVINVGSEVEIDTAKTTDGWFYVCTTTGIEGYCMRQYVNASL